MPIYFLRGEIIPKLHKKSKSQKVYIFGLAQDAKEESKVLVTTIFEGDYILIGNNVRVHFDHRVTKDTISISIEAPKDVTVLRGKLYEERGCADRHRPCDSSVEISTLRITTKIDEYVMVGNEIKIKHKGNSGKGLSIGIAAPKDVAILRKSLYEGGIEKAASEGDIHAQIIADMLSAQHEERRRISEARKTKQLSHRQRILSEQNKQKQPT